MNINDSPNRLKNEATKPPIPNGKEPTGRYIIDIGTPRSSSKSLLFTPLSQHRKTQSFVQNSPRYNRTPSKTRFDYDSLPLNPIDVRACEAEVLRQKMQEKKAKQFEKALEKEEWYKINSQEKKLRDAEIVKHEGFLVNENVQYRRMSEDKVRMRKADEKKEREEKMKQLREEKIMRLEMEKQSEKERILMDKEKFMKRQLEIEEEKERKRTEKEEKRKALLESIEARKRIKESEYVRSKKEREFEIAQYAHGLKGSLVRNNY